MKTKQLLFAFALTGTFALKVGAQNPSIPNGNFETWTEITSETPQNYLWSSNDDTYRHNMPFNVVKSTDAYHGNYAVQMTTRISDGDTVPGIFVNVNPQSDNPADWQGGFAYSQKPTGMSGYYKSAIASPDTAFVMAFFYKNGNMIGQYGFYFYGTHNAYTPFSISFSPALPQNPDTVIFGAGSSNFSNQNNMRNGSMLLLDYVSFTGVTSQPALFNGDFETWQSTTIDKPADWFFQESSNDNVTGNAFKTSDAKAGDYAIELITYEGERNDHPAAERGQISTGWYPDNCDGNCNEQGGYPFSNQIDTLAFWYKYAPSGGATASVYLTFKKNGNNIWNEGINLFASSNYQYVEIPFNTMQDPDSVIVHLESSQWQDSLLSFVGSDLKIDEIHFKSQPLTTGIFELETENAMQVFPNPTSEKLTLVSNENNGDRIDLDIFNAMGERVFTRRISDYTGTVTLDLSHIDEGVYFLRVTSDNQTFYDKKIMIVR